MSLREGIEILLNGVNKYSKESELKREEATKFFEGLKTESNEGSSSANNESIRNSEVWDTAPESRNK